MEDRLKDKLERFAENPEARGQDLRGLLALDSNRFCAVALPLLKNGLEKPGKEFLVGLLVEKNLLLGPLSDPACFSRAEALALATLASRLHPMLDVKLARQLSELEGSAAERVLAILDAISDGSRIIPMLASLMREANPRLRSKSALLIGRATKRSEWVEGRMEEADARTRANAVEALWGADSGEARTVLAKALHDSNCRVAANALVGLYKLGDPASILPILEMSLHEEPAFRAAAAWAMGATADPRFVPALARMNPEPKQSVGRNIKRATRRIESAMARAAESGRLEVRVTSGENLLDSARRLLVGIAVEGWEPAAFSPTQFIIWEGSEAVARYESRRGEEHEALAVGFVLCGSADLSEQDLKSAKDGVLECLEYKRNHDAWSVVQHIDELVRFMTDKPALKKALQTVPGSSGGSSAPVDVFTRLAERARDIRASKNLIVLTGPNGLPAGALPANRPELDHIVQVALDSKAAIHALIAGNAAASHEVETLCRKTGGSVWTASGAEHIPRAYQQIYSSLLNRYEILYRPRPGSENVPVRVQVHSERGCGEATEPRP